MTLEDMREVCDVCNADLEIGQIGKCDDCSGEHASHQAGVDNQAKRGGAQ